MKENNLPRSSEILHLPSRVYSHRALLKPRVLTRFTGRHQPLCTPAQLVVVAAITSIFKQISSVRGHLLPGCPEPRSSYSEDNSRLLLHQEIKLSGNVAGHCNLLINIFTMISDVVLAWALSLQFLDTG